MFGCCSRVMACCRHDSTISPEKLAHDFETQMKRVERNSDAILAVFKSRAEVGDWSPVDYSAEMGEIHEGLAEVSRIQELAIKILRSIPEKTPPSCCWSYISRLTEMGADGVAIGTFIYNQATLPSDERFQLNGTLYASIGLFIGSKVISYWNAYQASIRAKETSQEAALQSMAGAGALSLVGRAKLLANMFENRLKIDRTAPEGEEGVKGVVGEFLSTLAAVEAIESGGSPSSKAENARCMFKHAVGQYGGRAITPLHAATERDMTATPDSRGAGVGVIVSDAAVVGIEGRTASPPRDVWGVAMQVIEEMREGDRRNVGGTALIRIGSIPPLSSTTPTRSDASIIGAGHPDRATSLGSVRRSASAEDAPGAAPLEAVVVDVRSQGEV